MGKRKGKLASTGSPARQRGRRRLWVSGAICLAILACVAAWVFLLREGATGEAAQFRGGPRLAVDKELIDFGAVRYNQYVEARFHLKNVGDQPLHLPVSPPVEVVEGC
jgi:hypothetical protein